MQTDIMKAYCSGLVEALSLGDVDVRTWPDWLSRRLRRTVGKSPEAQWPTRAESPVPASVTRIRTSFGLLCAVEEHAARSPAPQPGQEVLWYYDLLSRVLEDRDTIRKFDDTRLLDDDTIEAARTRLNEIREIGALDATDDALLLRALQIARQRQGRGKEDLLDHIVIDEVQDLTVPELAVVIGSVERTYRLTLVGDVGQQTSEGLSFPGWDKLRQHWSFEDESSRYVALTVSHRSTLPIMKLADHVQREKRVTSGRNGRIPIWFKCLTETRGVGAAIKWLETALGRYPNDLTAVVCRSRSEAKHVHSLLEPTFGATVQHVDDRNFSLDSGLLVIDVEQAKGLEFVNVLIWNPTVQSYSASRRAANLLYVAITRAEENLSLVTWQKPSPLLPSLHSKLVRGIDMDPEDEE